MAPRSISAVFDRLASRAARVRQEESQVRQELESVVGRGRELLEQLGRPAPLKMGAKPKKSSRPAPPPKKRYKRRFSVQARANMAAAAKRRWAREKSA